MNTIMVTSTSHDFADLHYAEIALCSSRTTLSDLTVVFSIGHSLGSARATYSPEYAEYPEQVSARCVLGDISPLLLMGHTPRDLSRQLLWG